MRVHELEFSNFGWRLVHVNIALPPPSWIIGHKCYLTLLESDTSHTSEHSWTFLAGINLLCNSAAHSWPDPCSSDFSAMFCQCKKHKGRTRSVCWRWRAWLCWLPQKHSYCSSCSALCQPWLRVGFLPMGPFLYSNPCTSYIASRGISEKWRGNIASPEKCSFWHARTLPQLHQHCGRWLQTPSAPKVIVSVFSYLSCKRCMLQQRRGIHFWSSDEVCNSHRISCY